MRKHLLSLSVAALSFAACHGHVNAAGAAPVSASAPASASAAAPSAPGKLFEPPKAFVDNWKSLAGTQAVGRIAKLEPWKKYESLAPCTISESYCNMVVPLLQVATVEIAKSGKSPGSPLFWIVTLPKPQNAQVGDYVIFEFPTEPKEMAQAAYDGEGKAIKPKCSWGKASPDAATEGVICEKWRYSDLKFDW